MTPHRRRTALLLSISALAGLTTPWTVMLIFSGLGGMEAGLAEGAVRHFGITHAGVQFLFDAVVPCIDASVCAVIFGVPLGVLFGGRFFPCWVVFVVGTIVGQAIVALLMPSPFGGFWDEMQLMLLPFWWLFFVVLLGILALIARVRSPVSYAA